MSFQAPAQYAELPSVAIPHTLVGDQLKQFNGMRCVIKTLPSASGSSVPASSSLLFNIPAEPYGYIKASSMYLRGSVTLTWATFADTNLIAFAGNSFGYTPSTSNVHGTGGASSMFTRMTVTLPGGASMTYGQQNIWRNAVIPHILNKQYLEHELRDLEFAGATRPFTSATGSPTTATFHFCIPVDIPLFNSSAAFPLLLMSGGVQLEMVTATVGEAFWAGGSGTTTSPQSYALNNLSLVYEVLQVTPDFKAALVSSKASNPYMIHVADRMSIGPVGISSSTRYNFGVGLSSVKSIVFTEQVASSAQSVTSTKGFIHNGMESFSVYRDGQLMSIPNVNSSSVCFAELNRSLGRVFDPVMISANATATILVDGGSVSSYCHATAGSFLAGCSFENIDDWSFSAQGSPCDQVALEIAKTSLTLGTASADVTKYKERWGNVGVPVSAYLYIWVLHDTVVVVLPDGTCQVRK